jgi:hypothetical protein
VRWNLVNLGMDEFAQTEWEAVGELVKDVAAVGVRAEHASGDQLCQVLGNIGLGGADEIDNFGNATGCVTQGLQDCEAKGVGQRAEEGGHGLKLSV